MAALRVSYIGKDTIHYGCGLDLDPDLAWKKIRRHVRRKIHAAEAAGVIIERGHGDSEELARLRRIWYYPDDPNFPGELSADDFLYLAHLGGELVGGMILLPVGSHLFLNNLTATASGKDLGVQSQLLWHAINQLRGSRYRYIDVGVSYRPNLYLFFDSWATFHYPVIFNPPPLRPVIRFQPFQRLLDYRNLAVDRAQLDAWAGGRPFTVVPDIEHARTVTADLGRPVAETRGVPDGRAEIEIVDLTRVVATPYGALIAGAEVPAETLWTRHGCFDFVKTEYLHKLLSLPENAPAAVTSARLAMHAEYTRRFAGEDVAVAEAPEFVDGFAIRTEAALRLSERLHRFDVAHELDGERLLLPCHQGLTAHDVEYVYAIYRGFLNLCSEWTPTYKRGDYRGMR